MKRTLVAAWVVGICMMGWGVEAMAQEVTTLIRVNTDDTAAYLAWAEESMPIVMAAAGADPLVAGVCVPMFGAEQEGDINVWTNHPSFAAALSVDLDTPAAARENREGGTDTNRCVPRSVGHHQTEWSCGSSGRIYLFVVAS